MDSGEVCSELIEPGLNVPNVLLQIVVCDGSDDLRNREEWGIGNNLVVGNKSMKLSGQLQRATRQSNAHCDVLDVRAPFFGLHNTKVTSFTLFRLVESAAERVIISSFFRRC